MKILRITLALIIALSWSGLVGAQTAPQVQFTADIVQANGQATPTLTWDTIPAADSCTASGDWSGAKTSSGTELLPTINTSATYNLSCTWAGGVTLSWTAPTQNEDGSALTDLASYKFYYGQTSGIYSDSVAVANPNATTFIVSPITAGDWFFVGTAINTNGVESRFSNEAMKTVLDTIRTEFIGITINAIPNPPMGLTAT